MFLIIATVVLNYTVAQTQSQEAVGRNHWTGNCIALCSGAEEYFIDAGRAVNRFEGPYQVWKSDGSGEQVNCDCDGYYAVKNKSKHKELIENTFVLEDFDIGLAIDSLMEPVRSFYQIDIDGGGTIDFLEARDFFSNGDPAFDEKHFSRYFSWISGKDGLQEFDEAVIFSAIQGAQMVMHYSMANGNSVIASINNALEVSINILEVFNLGDEEFRRETMPAITGIMLEAFVEVDERDDNQVLETFNLVIEENLLMLIRD
ncbi:MAG: hypothetical protein VX294_09965 [Candidatus Latescibacterota bacterium]|nr:hypothetical protein [Candidatus Latescibacterota bacterium]